jgi:predicted glycoside hydrolase/deacetylase ChbG (UPF0249 family)
MRKVVINGDDFGLSPVNNAGIINAYEHGVLSAASLMVGGDAAAEAVDYAREHPFLAVGLHINFSDTRPVLPPEQVPLLVQSNGYFPPDDAAHHAALRSAAGRQQMRAEIAAQFARFAATKLPCDHVNTHRHVHLNPLVAWMVFSEAARWKLCATRIPWDAKAERLRYGNAMYPLRYSRQTFLRNLGAYYNLRAPDRTINRAWANHQLADYLAILPDGVTEIFFHPVTATDHEFADDLPTLLDDGVRAAIAKLTLQGMTPATLQ